MFFSFALFLQENSNDLLEKENIELMPIRSTSQENGTAVAALMSTENIDDDDPDADDFLDQKNTELMPMPPTSKANSNAATILISIENTDDDDDDDGDDDDDDDEDEENSNDLLDQESMELVPMPSTTQGERNASAILLSAENIDDDDDDKDDFLDQKRLELLSIPSTSQGNRNAAAILTSFENIDNDDDEEADSFTTQKLFSFAWQIAKGMVGVNTAYLKWDNISFNSDSRPLQEKISKQIIKNSRRVLHASFIGNYKHP